MLSAPVVFFRLLRLFDPSVLVPYSLGPGVLMSVVDVF